MPVRSRNGLREKLNPLWIDVVILLEKFFKQLERTADLLLRHIGQGRDFLECAQVVTLPACDEDARRNNGCLGLALESLRLLCHLEQMLHRVRDLLR